MSKFTSEEITDSINGLAGLEKIIVPVLKNFDYKGMGEEDAFIFRKHLQIAVYALFEMLMEENE